MKATPTLASRSVIDRDTPDERAVALTPAAPRGAEAARDDAGTALTIFSVLWAVGALFHQAAYTESVFGRSALFVSLPALWLLMRPSSLSRLMILVLLQGAQVWRWGPAHASNHWLFATAVNATILLAFLGLAIQHRRRVRRSELFLAFAPVVRIELAILYFFAVLHKLNTDFLDPVTSCAVYQYGQIAALYAMLPMGAWVDQATIYGTLIVEAAIPILLLIRRTRIVGLVLGLLFHFVLAINPQFVFFDFSSIVFACFFLFIPFDYWRSWKERPVRTPAGEWIRARVGGGRMVEAARLFAVALIGLLVFAYFFRLTPDSPEAASIMRETVRFAFVVYGIVLLLFLFKAVRTTDVRERVRGLDRVGIPQPWLAIVPLTLLLNGFAPYLGLKTESSFAMFSNLRTEVVTNHLLIPTSVKVAGFQEDLVTIESSSAPELARFAERGTFLTWFDFRSRALRLPDASVTYVRNGDRFFVPRLADDETIAAPHWLARRVIAFRPVQPVGRDIRCAH